MFINEKKSVGRNEVVPCKREEVIQKKPSDLIVPFQLIDSYYSDPMPFDITNKDEERYYNILSIRQNNIEDIFFNRMDNLIFQSIIDFAAEIFDILARHNYSNVSKQEIAQFLTENIYCFDSMKSIHTYFDLINSGEYETLVADMVNVFISEVASILYKYIYNKFVLPSNIINNIINSSEFGSAFGDLYNGIMYKLLEVKNDVKSIYYPAGTGFELIED